MHYLPELPYRINNATNVVILSPQHHEKPASEAMICSSCETSKAKQMLSMLDVSGKVKSAVERLASIGAIGIALIGQFMVRFHAIALIGNYVTLVAEPVNVVLPMLPKIGQHRFFSSLNLAL